MTQGYQIESRGPVEMIVMRILFAAIVIWSMPAVSAMAELTQQPRPAGLAKLFPLTFLSNPEIFGVLRWSAIAALAFYAAGIALPAALTIVTAVHILSLTLYNSQGVPYHSHNIVSLTLLAQWLVYLFPWVYRLFRRKKLRLPEGKSLADLSFHYSLHIIAGVYVIAGVIKLLRTKGLWIWQSPDIAVELMKSNAQTYYNWLEIDGAYEHRQQIAQWMIENPNITRLFLGSGLLIEFFAFLALYNRLAALIGGLAFLGLHWGIGKTMGLHFHYNMAMILVFFINVPFWMGWLRQKASGNALKPAPSFRPDFPWRRK